MERNDAFSTPQTASLRGFILDVFHRLHRNRDLICVIGRLENGESFAWTDDRVWPRFYIRLSDREETLRRIQDTSVTFEPTERTTMDGEQTLALRGRLADLRRLADRLSEDGIRAYEADLNLSMQYLIHTGLRGSVQIAGPWRRGEGVSRVYRNPTLAPSDWTPDLSVLSLDIETGPEEQVFAAALVVSIPGDASRIEEIHVIGHTVPGDPPHVVSHPDEKTLLVALAGRIQRLDPDILTGWNIVDFDLPVLASRFALYGLPFQIGRTREQAWYREGRAWGGSRMVIYGRPALDALHMIRATMLRFDDYRLDTVARALLGRGKTLKASDDEDMAERIRRAFAEDRVAFLDYCLEDARLVQDILDREGLIRITVRRSQLTGLPLERAWGSVAAFDAMYISELRALGMVAPSVGVDRLNRGGSPGGLIIEPKVGLYRHVWVFDFRSLYPSIIRTFNIDPLACIRASGNGDPDEQGGNGCITAPNGARFDGRPGLLPAILERFFTQRALAKKEGDALASLVYKILMNACYGVLATGACRFSDSALAGAITGFGHLLLRWVRDLLEKDGYRALYGDTDSLFVASGLPDSVKVEDALREGAALCRRVNERLSHYVSDTYGVTSHLELEFEKYYRRFLLPSMRADEDRGRAKGYAGLLVDASGERVEIVGMEAVRRDWTDMARDLQREMLEMLFHDASAETVEQKVFDRVRAVRSGKKDADLVYRKSLRKPVADYTRSKPPHVQAARLMPNPSGVIHYVVTTSGPQPAGRATAPLDYDHYIQKQIDPLVRAIAEFCGVDTDAAVHGRPRLFR